MTSKNTNTITLDSIYIPNYNDIKLLRDLIKLLESKDKYNYFCYDVKIKGKIFNYFTDYPDYHRIIKNPMSFKKIKNKYFTNKSNIENFFEDLNLIWKNCKTYNSDKSDIYYTATALEAISNDFVKINFKNKNTKINKKKSTQIPKIHKKIISDNEESIIEKEYVKINENKSSKNIYFSELHKDDKNNEINSELFSIKKTQKQEVQNSEVNAFLLKPNNNLEILENEVTKKDNLPSIEKKIDSITNFEYSNLNELNMKTIRNFQNNHNNIDQYNNEEEILLKKSTDDLLKDDLPIEVNNNQNISNNDINLELIVNSEDQLKFEENQENEISQNVIIINQKKITSNDPKVKEESIQLEEKEEKNQIVKNPYCLNNILTIDEEIVVKKVKESLEHTNITENERIKQENFPDIQLSNEENLMKIQKSNQEINSFLELINQENSFINEKPNQEINSFSELIKQEKSFYNEKTNKILNSTLDLIKQENSMKFDESIPEIFNNSKKIIQDNLLCILESGPQNILVSQIKKENSIIENKTIKNPKIKKIVKNFSDKAFDLEYECFLYNDRFKNTDENLKFNENKSRRLRKDVDIGKNLNSKIKSSKKFPEIKDTYKEIPKLESKEKKKSFNKIKLKLKKNLNKFSIQNKNNIIEKNKNNLNDSQIFKKSKRISRKPKRFLDSSLSSNEDRKNSIKKYDKTKDLSLEEVDDFM